MKMNREQNAGSNSLCAQADCSTDFEMRPQTASSVMYGPAVPEERICGRPSFPLLLLLIFCCVFSLGAKRPNIVIISASNLGFSDLGCYGSEIRTPAIDKLAEEGMLFTQFYSCGNNAMSQTALMTGQYPHRVGMGVPMVDLELKGYRGSITQSTITLAEFLKSAGYTTLMSGKWGLTRHYKPNAPSFAWPLNRGFEKFYGTILSQTSYFEPQFLMMNSLPYPFGEEYYHTYAVANEAVEFLDQTRGRSNPFFLYVAFTAPSWPLHAPEEEVKRYARQYVTGWDLTRSARFEEMTKRGLLPYGTQLPPRDERVSDWSRVGSYAPWHSRRMEIYAAQISAMDRGVGMIMNKLKQLGADEDTIVIFLSDCGASGAELSPKTKSRSIPAETKEGAPVQVGNIPSSKPGGRAVFQSCGVPWANVSNTPFRGYAESVYEGGIAVPCIIRWNQHSDPGKVIEPVHIIDILPTLVEISEHPFPKELGGHDTLPPAGRSMVPLFSVNYRSDLMTAENRKHRYFFWEVQGNIAIRHGYWKLVLPRHGRQWELYHMAADRCETKNVFIQNQTKPEIVEMIARYERWKKVNRVLNWEDVSAHLRSTRKK